MNITKQTKGQILVILVIVLLLLSIIVMTIIAVVTRNTRQVVSSKQYSQSYAKSEEKLLEILSEYSDINLSLDTLLSKGCVGSNFAYTCTFDEEDSITTLFVEDTYEVNDFELEKDESLKLILNGSYRGNLDIKWTGNSAIEMTLEYKNANNEFKSIKDIYDNHSVLSQSGLSNNDHLMNFTVVNPNENYISLNLNSISGISADDILLFFKIKILSKQNTSSLITVEANSSFPRQIRRFEVATKFKTNTDSAMPVLISQVPLAGRQPELFDYVLLTPNQIVK